MLSADFEARSLVPPEMVMSAAEEAGDDMARKGLAHVLGMEHAEYAGWVIELHNHTRVDRLNLSRGFMFDIPVASVERRANIAHKLRSATYDTHDPRDGQPVLVVRWLWDASGWSGERWHGYHWAERMGRWIEAGRFER